MTRKTTWKPHTEHGELSAKDREELPDSVFAFPDQRKLPLTDASHSPSHTPQGYVSGGPASSALT